MLDYYVLLDKYAHSSIELVYKFYLLSSEWW